LRGRLLAAVLGLVLLAALLVRGTGRGAAWAPFPPAAPPPRAVAPRTPVPRPAPTPWEPSRNVFLYADGPAVAGPLPAPPLPSEPRGPRGAVPVPAATTAPAAVRVVGLIRRGGQLKAALMVQGEMALAGKGERAGGYTVLDVDEETGVRVRGPAGEETVLPPPRF
jgi:hypothetical protein